ncbi:MAG: hypothetical protein E7612_01530 [Ruminococcaceae bacterium]|nr:hypothetical protein [Oscillospiraceae bacterium]
MTEKLYYKDAYIKEFFATVLSCKSRGEYYEIILDKTAFFPEEGGQYSDKGYLGDVRVFDVKEKDGIITHLTNAPFIENSTVNGRIDFDERFEKMQCHTAEHIISGIIHSLFGLENVGFHLGEEEVTMDVSAPLTRKQLNEVEALANEAVYKNVKVTTEFPAPEELSALEYRSKLDLSENIRIVYIGEYDACACCAPHVAYTGEIGAIKILDFTGLRGGTRIRIAAGRRAMRIFSGLLDGAQAISSMLSVPKNEISAATKRLLDDFTAQKNSFAAYRISVMERQAEKLSFEAGNRLIVFSDASVSEMIAFSNIAVLKTEGILVLLSGNDGDYKYVISSNTVNLREITQDVNKSLLGRGGGKPNMIQGSFSSSEKQIREYFNL